MFKRIFRAIQDAQQMRAEYETAKSLQRYEYPTESIPYIMERIRNGNF